MSEEEQAAPSFHDCPDPNPDAVAAAVANDPPPPPQDKIIEILPCPCGMAVDKLRLEVPGKGAKIGTVVGTCCGTWMVEFLNNTEDPQQSFERAVAAWNAAPRPA